jgi:RHS repeat-associated protein
VYEVANFQRVGRARSAPNFADTSWQVGTARKTGDVRLIKGTFSSGALHTYDENGQPTSVVGCGVRTDWLERNGIGQVTLARDIHHGLTNYNYGSGGELLSERVGEKVFQNEYLDPDSDPGTLNPGAGQVRLAALVTPSESMSELQVGYEYALDGSLDQVDRYRRGKYAGKNATADDIVSTTTYNYDGAGLVEDLRTVRYAATAPVIKKSKKAGKAKPNKPGNSKPTAHKKKPEGVQGDGTAQLVYSQTLTRDLAGNPRWISETQRMAESATIAKVRTRTKSYSYDLADRMVQDHVGDGPVRTYGFDGFGRLSSVRVPTGFLETYDYDEDTRSLGVMLPIAQMTRDNTQDPLKLTRLVYGNGKRPAKDEPNAGPRGQLIAKIQYDGSIVENGIETQTRYGYTSLNQLARATDIGYDILPGKGKAKKVKIGKKTKLIKPKVSRADRVQQEWTHYDLLGRRLALIQSADDPSDAADPTYTSTEMIYAGADQDPFAEISSNPNDPDTRWIQRVGGAIVGELRADGALDVRDRNYRPRYMLADQQGSTVATVDADAESPITATFDFDAYGAPEKPSPALQGPGVKNRLLNPNSFASGIAKERSENSYAYTGMRQNAVGGTTFHHARDYSATLRGWIETDQYMDPMADLGLSLGASTRDRHGYAMGNPVAYTDTDGHCSNGDDPSVAGACAVGLAEYCKRHSGADRCPAAQTPSLPNTTSHTTADQGNQWWQGGGVSNHRNPEDYPATIIRAEARVNSTPITWDAPDLPWDQRISFEVDNHSDQAWQGVAEVPYGVGFAGYHGGRRMGCHRNAGWFKTTVRAIPCRTAEGAQLVGFGIDAGIDVGPKQESPWDDGFVDYVAPGFVCKCGPRTMLYGMGTDRQTGQHFIDFCGSPVTTRGLAEATGAEVRCR